MRSFKPVLVYLCLGVVTCQEFNPACPEPCLSYILQDTNGPRVHRYIEQPLDTTYTGGFQQPSRGEYIIPGMSFMQRRSGLQLLRPLTYRISTKTNGNVIINVNGQILRVPQDLPRLTDIVQDKVLLTDIIKQLQELGVPLKQQNNRIVVQPDSSAQSGYTIRVQIKWIDGKPSNVAITFNTDKYTVPGDERALNNFLAREPEVSYQLLKILAGQKIPVDYNQDTKELSIELIPDEEGEPSRASVPAASSPTGIIRIGTMTYYLPQDNDKLKRDILAGKVSRESVQRLLNRQQAESSGDPTSPTSTKIISPTSRILVNRNDDDISIDMNGRKYKLPKDSLLLQDALKQNNFPIELLRDSLLRVAIDSMRMGSSLRIVLPKGDTYISGGPSNSLYDYRIAVQQGGVQITTETDVYNLPRDQSLLQRDIEGKKVLPRTLIDALNGIGIPARMDFENQEMTITLSTGVLRIPVVLSIKTVTGTSLRLRYRGYPGDLVYTLTIGDAGEQVELPSQISTLNSLIRSGRVEANLLMKLFDQLGVSHYFDPSKNFHIVTLNDKPFEISAASSSQRR